VALCALLIGSACSGGDEAGGDHGTAAAQPAPPGPPTDACALLDEGEVAAIAPGSESAGEGTETEPDQVADSAVGAPVTRYADCSWPAIDGAGAYLTWVQPSPSPNAVVWLERAIAQSADPEGQEAVALELGEEGLDAAELVRDGTVLRIVGVVRDTDLITIEVLQPPVVVGSPEQSALEQALVAAAHRLS
jgi:hypothetical protein